VTEFHLPTLLGEVCSEMNRRVEDKDQKLALVLAPGIEGLRGDRDFVRRILENLIDNAYKYGPRHATISVDVRPAVMDDGVEPGVEIRVRDEGEGIPAAYRQLIFEKYGRVEPRPANEARNSHGLGLVFCRRAVAVHGGAIWVEDGNGRGGCFCVRLPVARLPLPSASATTPTAPKGSFAFG
jgi:signal transduction histidine kinase